MYNPRILSIITTSILIIFLIISFYNGIIAPPPLITFTTDENFIGESGIFLLFGITPRALEWAAIPSTLIAYLFFMIWSVFSLIKNISTLQTLPDVLKTFDENAFYYLNHREEFVLWERGIQIILVGIIVFKTIQFIIHSKNPVLKPEIKVILSALCLCSDVVWVTVPLIRPEALSGVLYLFLTVKLLFTEKITPKIGAGLLIIFILTFTQRLIFLFFGPFVVGTILIHLWQQKIPFKTYLNYVGFVLMALLAIMPFLITNTFVVLKSFVGGIFIKINHDEMNTYFNMTYINNFLAEPINLIFAFFCFVGIWSLIKIHASKSVAIFFVLNFVFVLFSSLKASQLYRTHTFPLSVMAITLIAFGIYGSVAWLKASRIKWVLGILSLFLLLNSWWIIQRNKMLIVQQQQNLADAILWVKSLNNNETILLTLDFDGLIAKNKACLMREYKANENENYRMNKLSKLLKMPQSDSVGKFTLPILAQSFAFEDEKLFDIQYQIALKYIANDVNKRFNTDYFFENNFNMSHCFEKKEAYGRFQAGKYRYLVTKEQLPDLKPINSFLKKGGDAYWAYEFQK